MKRKRRTTIITPTITIATYKRALIVSARLIIWSVQLMRLFGNSNQWRRSLLISCTVPNAFSEIESIVSVRFLTDMCLRDQLNWNQ
ncbi:hypothetical protein PENTCL1PPCAC_7511 [Pristionchus entomophagus]|uniref:G protein-coupled receptor n=1 Tax=Pristionchus entomophagus TaxID=358040 RepID=A0AAV5SQ70_9BILA|nr:hypothetical protein PENTCL1PPCAC_7511 [Pristionchus entomophagus]